MTFKGQYKLDDGTNVVMDCFPVRKIFKGGYQSAGHWVEAQKSPKQKDFQAVLGPKPPTPRVFAAPSPTSKPHVAQIPKSAKEKVLDGNYLMLLHCVDNQSDLCVANISDQDLNAVNEEDFHLFDSVAYINAAANHLPFEPFRLFPALRELDLSANALQNLLVISQDFPHLEVLNLSYNNVSKEDILALGILPQLKVLHLTGNNLDSLPPDLTAPYDPVDRLEEPLLRFPVLEVLMLDENRLSDPCVFSSLAGLHRLKYLNLDQNNFTGVPYLQQMETSAPFEKTESAQLCHSIISQIKQPIKCPSVPSVEISVFQSDIEAERQSRGRGERAGKVKRVEEGKRAEERVEQGVGMEQGERVGEGETVVHGAGVQGERVGEGGRMGEGVEQGERVGERGRVGEGESVEQGVRVEQGERMWEEEMKEHGERVGKAEGEQKEVEKDEKEKAVEEEEEMKDEQEVDDDEEFEEDEEEVEEPFADALRRPVSSDDSLGKASTAVEGQETMDQLLETPEAKQMCFPEATYEFLPPFSGLTHLSLAKNKVSDDEELLAVCLFPALSKLTICKNPITLSTGKKPHLVISMLKDRLGIEVITSEPRPVDRPPVLKVFSPKRKVDSHIPKIPKQPLMLETAKQLLSLECGCPGGSQRGGAEPRPPGQADDIGTHPASATHGTSRAPDGISEPTTGTPEKQHQEAMDEKPVEGFFMTQVEDITLNSENKVALEIKQTAVPSVTDLPERYKGYEELLDATTDPYFVEPVGIQQNVQQLEQHLRKLQLYPDPFSSVNLQKGPYVPKQRKNLPESTSHKSKADKMEEILKRMKEQRAMTVIPLAHVLRGKGVTRQEYEEAVALLRDLQLKYVEMRRQLAANVNRLCEELGSKRPDAGGSVDQDAPSTSQP